MKKIILLLTISSTFLQVVAQDYIGMAVQFGNNMQNILHTEIMNDAGRNAMKASTNKTNNKHQQASKKYSWPTHINSARISSHIFTIAELENMHYSDGNKAKSLIAGKNITLTGTVKNPDRKGKNYIDLVNFNSPYRAWIYYGQSKFPTLKDGDIVTIKGVASLERRSYITIKNPQLVSTGTNVSSQKNSTTKKPDSILSTSKRISVNYSSLNFTRSNTVTKEINEVLATQLESTLKKGATKQELLSILNSGELQQKFKTAISKQGFNNNNLSDVLSASMILCWQVINDLPSFNEPEGYKKIQQEMKETLSSFEWVSRLTHKQKQSLADLTSTGSMIISSRYLHGKQNNEMNTVKSAQQDSYLFIKELTGMDLRQYKLTKKGFEKK